MPKSKLARGSRGMTLVETMVTLVVATIGGLALLTLTTNMQKSANTTKRTVANTYYGTDGNYPISDGSWKVSFSVGTGTSQVTYSEGTVIGGSVQILELGLLSNSSTNCLPNGGNRVCTNVQMKMILSLEPTTPPGGVRSSVGTWTLPPSLTPITLTISGTSGLGAIQNCQASGLDPNQVCTALGGTPNQANNPSAPCIFTSLVTSPRPTNNVAALASPYTTRIDGTLSTENLEVPGTGAAGNPTANVTGGASLTLGRNSSNVSGAPSGPVSPTQILFQNPANWTNQSNPQAAGYGVLQYYGGNTYSYFSLGTSANPNWLVADGSGIRTGGSVQFGYLAQIGYINSIPSGYNSLHTGSSALMLQPFQGGRFYFYNNDFGVEYDSQGPLVVRNPITGAYVAQGNGQLQLTGPGGGPVNASINNGVVSANSFRRNPGINGPLKILQIPSSEFLYARAGDGYMRGAHYGSGEGCDVLSPLGSTFPFGAVIADFQCVVNVNPNDGRAWIDLAVYSAPSPRYQVVGFQDRIPGGPANQVLKIGPSSFANPDLLKQATDSNDISSLKYYSIWLHHCGNTNDIYILGCTIYYYATGEI